MADLRTDYKDDVLDTSKNEKRKYNLIQNADGTFSLEDVTAYTQVGDSFGAADINTTNKKVNDMDSSLIASDGLKFRFGKDGDGNYGYYGADDSLIPFSSLFFRNMTPYVFNDIYQNPGAQTFHDFDQNYKYIMFVGHTSSVGIVSVFKHDGTAWNEISNPQTHLNVVFSFDTSMNRLWITNNFSETLLFYLVGFK